MQNHQAPNYPGQPESEITQAVVYKHYMAIAPIVLGIALISLAAIVASFFYNQYAQTLPVNLPDWAVNLAGFLAIAMVLFLSMGTFWIWRRNKVVITNQHIVDIDQIGVFNRTVSTLRLEEIQDIKASVRGPIQTILKFGTIVIHTAGNRENFVFDYMPKPYELEHFILQTRKKYHGQERD